MLAEHLDYVSDALRLDRFRHAIAARLRPGDRVADLGCGTGVLGLLCLQAGAAHVHAIDDSPMLDVARRAFDVAGHAAHVSLYRGSCESTTLPEKVDLAIADHVGYFGIDYGILSLFRDARARLLRPGGLLIPSRLRLLVALAGSPRCAALARGEAAGPLVPEFRWMRDLAANTRHPVTLAADELLGAPSMLGELELGADGPELLRWTAVLQAHRDGCVNGMAGWFEADLAPGVTMTNSPLAPDAIRRPHALFPIGEGVAVRSGDEVRIVLLARPDDHLLRWQVEFPASGRRFSHSTWEGEAFDAVRLARIRPDRAPRLAALGRARLALLAACDGRRSIGELQADFVRDHGALFPTAAAAARFAAQVLDVNTE